MLNTDEMLRVYQAPDGRMVVRVGNRCFLTLDTEGNYFLFAVPDEDSQWCAEAVVKKWQLKRLRTFNIELEQEVEGVIWKQNVGRREARGIVACARKLARSLTQSLLSTIEVRMSGPESESTLRYKGGKLTEVEEPDVLDEEFIDTGE